MGFCIAQDTFALVLGALLATLTCRHAQALECPSTVMARPLPLRETYRVGVLAIRGIDTAFNEFNATTTYLTKTAGAMFDPPINFETIPVGFTGDVVDELKSGSYDFIYANPTLYSCISSELGTHSLVTKIAKRNVGGNVYKLTRFGGVIITRADNDEINSIKDIKDKRVGLVSLIGLGSGQMQFRELQRAGLHHLQDPKQLILMKSQVNVVNGVLSGDIDVGFIRTDQLERTIDTTTGELVDRSRVKIIRPFQGLESDGAPFPFESSTELYPEWNVAGLPHVPEEVRRAVQISLMELNDHAAVAPSLRNCVSESGCGIDLSGFCHDQCVQNLADANLVKHCRTTVEVSSAAEQAAAKGNYAGWRSSESYMELRNMQEEVGFIKFDQETNSMRCNRDTELSDAVVCPEGYFKRNPSNIENACEAQGLPCHGFTCLCKPCVKAFDVDFFPLETTRRGDLPFVVQNFTAIEREGCEKFSYCGSVEQGGRITFQAKDNKRRENATMEAIVLAGAEEERYAMKNIDDHSYYFDFSAGGRGVGSLIVEVFVNGKPIPESPFRFEVTQRDCELDTGNDLREPDNSGECVCNSNQSVEVFGKCVAFRVLIPCIIVPCVAIMALIVWVYAEHKRRQADSLWKVGIHELVIEDSPQSLGNGSFGFVFLANLRGTNVAVKQMHEARTINKSKRDTEDPEQSLPGSSSREAVLRQDGVGMISGLYSREDIKDITSSDGGSRTSCSSGFDLVDWFGHSSDDLSHHSNSIPSGPITEDGSTKVETSRPSKTSGSLDGIRRKEFVREMRHLSKLRHPNITTIMGATLEKGKPPMLIMEHMELGSLYFVLHNDGMILDHDIVFPICHDIASGLRFLHNANPPVIHGDLKSRNILIDAQFRAKVADFGLSTHMGSRKGKASGTPFWMAPELLRGESANTRESDMYSLGIVLYEIFSRKKPYQGENPKEALHLIADKKAKHRPPMPTSCPGDVGLVMRQCLDDDPTTRPTAEFAHELFRTRKSEATKRREELLYKFFPPSIAAALRDGRKLEPEVHQSVTVFFADIVDYPKIAASLPPAKVKNLLERLYSKLDRLCDLHKVTKIETVGDAYMTVTNLVDDQQDHVSLMARFSLDALESAAGTLLDEENPRRGSINIRIGFHTGPIAAHVVGSKNPRYTIIGDTVNIASKLESTSKAGKIQCSENSAQEIIKDCHDIDAIHRGNRMIKGRGIIETFWVQSIHDDKSNSSDKLPDEIVMEMGQEPGTNPVLKTEGDKARLVGRHVDVFKKYLIRLIKYRQAAPIGTQESSENDTLNSDRNGITLLDEVAEVIQLPNFNARAVQNMKTNCDAFLPKQVEGELYQYIDRISRMYRDNPFHSFQHAGHVTFSIDKLLTSVVSPPELKGVDDQRKDYTLHEYTYGISSDPLTQFAVLFSALIHDVDHPGVPNAILVKEKTPLASIYKDKSVAEQNSVALAWQLLLEPTFDQLRAIIAPTAAELARFRQLVINTVLATDIVDKELKNLRNSRWEKAFSESARFDDSPQDHTNRKATIVIEHLIQASDVAHTTQHWHVYRKWNEKFFQECYEAYLDGRADTDPSVNWYKGEIGFFDFYIIPLTRKLKECGVFGSASSHYLNCALRNKTEWEARGQAVVAEIVERARTKFSHKVSLLEHTAATPASF